VNSYQHNAKRRQHGAGSLTIDSTLAEGAKARAEVLYRQDGITSDNTWLTSKKGEICGESLIEFDSLTAKGLDKENW